MAIFNSYIQLPEGRKKNIISHYIPIIISAKKNIWIPINPIIAGYPTKIAVLSPIYSHIFH